MAFLEMHMGECSKCGETVPMGIYKTKVQLLLALGFDGKLEDLSAQELNKVFAEAQEADEQEQADGEVEAVARIAELGGGIFVDGRKEQNVCCPHCDALLYTISRPRNG